MIIRARVELYISPSTVIRFIAFICVCVLSYLCSCVELFVFV